MAEQTAISPWSESDANVRSILGKIEMAGEATAGGFQVFGLRWTYAAALRYCGLDEALAGSGFEITEVGEAGSVPDLKVSNRSPDRVVLLAGDQVVGAKQNRVVNTTVMIEAMTEVTLPVTCVEEGRWAYRSRGFASGGTSAHALLKMMMAKQASAEYARSGNPGSDQGEVWREVRRKLRAFGTSSPSTALQDAYESQKPRVQEVGDRIQPGDGWCGAAFAYDGRIVGLELFDQAATLKSQWPKLVGSYVIDSLEGRESPPVARARVREWLQALPGSTLGIFRPPGIGIDVRLEGRGVVGSMLVVDGVPVHLQVFADEPER